VIAMPGPLQAVLLQVSPVAAAIILRIAAGEGLFVSSSVVAAALGLRDRHVLRRLLQEEGLPNYSRLAGWIRVLIWLTRREERGLSLCEQASTTGSEPRSYYRTVQSVTGCTWRQLQSLGSNWLMLRVLEQCGRKVDPTAVPLSRAS
jgi:hypothetical protein